MADTAVAVTAGTGTNIDTRTESTNNNHRQVVVLGDPATNAGVAPVDGTAGLKVNLGADNDVTVTGTVDLGATDNAVLDAIAAATAASQTALELIDNAISGSEMQVDIVAALPAGSNTIGVVDLGATDNAVLDAMAASLAAMDDWDESNRAKVNLIASQAGITGGAGAVAANTPRVTLASDDPAVTSLAALDNAIYTDDDDWTDGSSQHVLVGGLYQSSPQSVTDGDVGPFQIDSNGRLLVALSATDNAVLDAIQTATEASQTALEALDNAISGSEMQVDIVAPLPAGTNAIGTLAANSGVDIGDVDVTSLIPGVGATSLGKAEDAAHSSGDTGVAALAVRRDAKAPGAGTDGDYATVNVNSSGDVRVDGGQAHIVQVAPTVTAGAYTADDVLGGEQTISNAARISGAGGILCGITMSAEDNDADGWAASNVEILIFDQNPAGTYTDNGALAVTDNDGTKLLASVILDTKVDCGDVTILYARNVNIPYICNGSTDLYAVAVNRGGVTPEATDAIQFTYHLIRDVNDMFGARVIPVLHRVVAAAVAAVSNLLLETGDNVLLETGDILLLEDGS